MAAVVAAAHTLAILRADSRTGVGVSRRVGSKRCQQGVSAAAVTGAFNFIAGFAPGAIQPGQADGAAAAIDRRGEMCRCNVYKSRLIIVTASLLCGFWINGTQAC